MRKWRSVSGLHGVGVALASSPGPVLLPAVCACCTEAPTQHSPILRSDGESLIVGYCDACAEHQANRALRRLALGLASLLLALVGAAGLPLLWPRVGLIGLVLSVCCLSLLPLVALILPTNLPSAPHTAHGPALIWGQGRQLLCASSSYAEQLRELNGAELVPAPIPEPRGSAWLVAGPLIGLAAACSSFFVYHPLLRILNLGSERVQVALDGEPLVFVDATSNESPTAGALLRVPAGQHTLQVSSADDGALVDRSEVQLQSGAVHLFAISAEDSCFWLETSGYGRQQKSGLRYEPLRSPPHFWALPSGIDIWFAPNPATSPARSSSSGGVLTALRQAPCREVPPEVRSLP